MERVTHGSSRSSVASESSREKDICFVYPYLLNFTAGAGDRVDPCRGCFDCLNCVQQMTEAESKRGCLSFVLIEFVEIVMEYNVLRI